MIDKDALFKPRLPEREVEVEGLGLLRVRGLSRPEGFDVKAVKGERDIEVAILSRAMVDPALTADEVRAWQAAAPAGELEPVVAAVLELSGLVPPSMREAVLSFRGEPDEASGVPRGPAVGDDGGPPP